VGDFGWTLTVTDCTTEWTEAGAVRTNAEMVVVAALQSCFRRYPGRVLSLHSDNGSEFMNGHLTRFCGARDITFTRSRPYQGNDNPHVEEKNNSVIRTFVGYDRHDSQGEEGLLNRLYLALHLLVNWFLPSQKLLRGVRTGSHITKVYDTAQTPCARILARKDVAEETKKRLLATSAELDMTSLLHEIFLPRGYCYIRGVYWPGPTG
jgi:transposase InsO family protein